MLSECLIEPGRKAVFFVKVCHHLSYLRFWVFDHWAPFSCWNDYLRHSQVPSVTLANHEQIVHLRLTNPSKGAGPTVSGIKRRIHCLLLVLSVPGGLHTLLQKYSLPCWDNSLCLCLWLWLWWSLEYLISNKPDIMWVLQSNNIQLCNYTTITIFLSLFFFQTGFYHVVQASLKLVIFQPHLLDTEITGVHHHGQLD
jgi:hypothetical protein